MRAHLDDVSRLHLVAQALAEQRMVLVLGDFEQNLQPGGGAFLNADVADWLAVLAQSVRAGRLLITSRYPVPGMDALFRTIGVGPLSPAEVRKLLLRLPALSARDADEIGRMVRMIGGHPRMLEFLDALLKGGAGRLPQVTEKLRQVARDAGLDLSSPIDALDAGLRATILLGSRDVLLEDLLALARARAADEALLQLAVSNLPMTAAGLARALAGSDH